MAAPSGQGGGQQGDDQEFLKLSIVALIVMMLLIAFIATQQYRINAFIGAVTWVHIAPFAYATRYVPFLADIPLLGPWLFGFSHEALNFLEAGGYAIMDPALRSEVLKAGGRAATVIYGGFFGWVIWNGRDFRVDQKYRVVHSLESMIWAQSQHWVTSRTARHVNPLNTGEIDSFQIAKLVAKKLKGAEKMPSASLPQASIQISPDTWHRSLRPEEWLLAHGVIFDPERYKALQNPKLNPKISDFQFPHKWEELDLQDILELFSMQLRTPWQGPEKLRPSHKAIFAIMALYYDYDVEGGNELLEHLALVSDGIKSQRGMDKAMAAEKGLIGRIEKIAHGRQGMMLAQTGVHHAWVESAFPTFLSVARKDRGVLPSAAFIWLKVEDRRMWYILNNVGNEAIMVEAAGAMAHSRAETQLGKPLRRPHVYQAARALLEDYLDITKERVAARHRKEVSRRNLGEQINLIHADLVQEADQRLKARLSAPLADGEEPAPLPDGDRPVYFDDDE